MISVTAVAPKTVVARHIQSFPCYPCSITQICPDSLHIKDSKEDLSKTPIPVENKTRNANLMLHSLLFIVISNSRYNQQVQEEVSSSVST